MELEHDVRDLSIHVSEEDEDDVDVESRGSSSPTNGENDEKRVHAGNRSEGATMYSSPSMSDMRSGITLEFSDVEFSVPDTVPSSKKESTKRKILKGIRGFALPGELLAVMGPSGSGKTTLLNALGGRLSGDLSGQISYSRRPLNRTIRKRIGYILQQDILLGNLSVYETLWCTARLRLGDQPAAVQDKAIEDVIRQLGLDRVRDSRIGTPFSRGLSGGEKKRVNIGNELLSNPTLILLDEPTSGLDSSTAYSLVHSLKTMAVEDNKTVVCTLHQPSSEIFELFDRLLFIADGEAIFFGRASEAVDYFSSVGYPCGPHYNPSDFIMGLVTDGIRSNTKEIRSFLSAQYIEKTNSRDFLFEEDVRLGLASSSRSLVRADFSSETLDSLVAERSPKEDLSSSETVWNVPFWTQFWTLAWRSMKQSRGELLTGVQLGQILAICAVVVLLWFRIPFSAATIQERIGYLFFSVVYFGFFSMFNALAIFPPEREVVNKERNAKTYRLSSYFLAKTLVDLPIQVIYPLLYTVLTWFLTGVDDSPRKFFTFLILNLISGQAAFSTGLAVGTAIMDFKKSLTISTVLMLFTMLFGGFYVASENIPHWIRWAQYISFVKFSFSGAIRIVFDDDISYPCIDPRDSKYNVCPVPGLTVIQGEDLPDVSLGGIFAILIGITIFLRFLAYLFLRFLNRPKNV